MWLRLIVLVALGAGCSAPSFDMPHSDRAANECNRYVDALLARGADCGVSPKPAAEVSMRDRCARVIDLNPFGERVDRCIDTIGAMACDAFTGKATLPWCHAFYEP